MVTRRYSLTSETTCRRVADQTGQSEKAHWNRALVQYTLKKGTARILWELMLEFYLNYLFATIQLLRACLTLMRIIRNHVSQNLSNTNDELSLSKQKSEFISSFLMITLHKQMAKLSVTKSQLMGSDYFAGQLEDAEAMFHSDCNVWAYRQAIKRNKLSKRQRNIGGDELTQSDNNSTRSVISTIPPIFNFSVSSNINSSDSIDNHLTEGTRCKMNQVLRLLRIAKGYSTAELAEMLSITPSYLSRVEAGAKTPSNDLLKKYSEIFHMRLSRILFFSETQNEEKLEHQYLLLRILEELCEKEGKKKGRKVS